MCMMKTANESSRTNSSIWTAIVTLLSASVVATAPGTAIAQEIVSASPDITIDLGASIVTADEDVAVDNQLGIVVLESLGVLPDASDVIALGFDVNGDRLIAFDTTTLLPGNVVARPGDVIRYNGASYSIEFDAAAAGVPTGVLADATSLAPGGLLLSFDTTVDLGGGLAVADEDLVRWIRWIAAAVGSNGAGWTRIASPYGARNGSDMPRSRFGCHRTTYRWC
jgi:hypothetical protein